MIIEQEDSIGVNHPPVKRILYVESSAAAKLADPCDLMILNGIRARYQVVRYFDLDRNAARLLQGEENQPAFDALITHLPMSGTEGDCYEAGLTLLSQIRAEFENPIIIYTGADHLVRQETWKFADEVASKEDDPRNNLKLILKALKAAWMRLAEPKMVVPPQLSYNDGWTVVAFRVQLVLGLKKYPSILIFKLCNRFHGNVLLEVRKGEKVASSSTGKDLIRILAMGSACGAPLRVSVEGTGEDAKMLAKQIYSIMTTRYPCQIDVDRFV